MATKAKAKLTNGASLSVKSSSTKAVRIASTHVKPEVTESLGHHSHTSSDLENNINHNLLPTVRKEKKNPLRPVSKRTKVARNQAEQELLASKQAHQKINYLAKKTRFNSDEVRALLEIYRKITAMGKFDRLRFREAFHNNLGLTDDVMLDRVFSAFDGDNEGNVSESEWVIGLSVMIRGNLEEQISYCYEVYDVNGDRAIGREELSTCLRGCLYPIPGHDHDDLDLEEGNREIVELAMRKLDLDRDGVIKYADFNQAVQQDPILLQAIGACLPTDHAMLTFVSLFDMDMRNYSTHLSHPSDPAWIREQDKFNPIVQEEINRRFNIRSTRTEADIILRSVFSRNKSVNSLKGTRFSRH